jgi:hypothetical protein
MFCGWPARSPVAIDAAARFFRDDGIAESVRAVAVV